MASAQVSRRARLHTRMILFCKKELRVVFIRVASSSVCDKPVVSQGSLHLQSPSLPTTGQKWSCVCRTEVMS